MLALTSILAVVPLLQLAHSHLVITYPGWRGDTLHTNGTLPQFDADALAVNQFENGTRTFPYGMGWVYPCGGLPQGTNRTKWPVSGGAVAFQPGWFQGHSQGQLYVNFGIQEQGMQAPPNMSHNVIKNVGFYGPTNEAWPGQPMCFPQVPMPTGYDFKVGDLVTLQVVLAAQHGAALYACVDLELAPDGDPSIPEVTRDNCYNDTNITMTNFFQTNSLTSGAAPMPSNPSSWAFGTVAVLMSAFALLA
ncbi:hypothetical protein K431DRAFT_343233 [Polychaeton citri CBS 116435]|uniref:Copper acquisition factor BIM1-like domain-containing protein n=1 Tax=Polychaeton citri CBS 116435 TaxID=1314669 RepID=A0A9P4QF31_9PEZI|nr:hypothetical protein K431DRAFT_343233 [Polychaeton citri CBS 116435]